MTSKERAFLRSKANGIDPVYQIGKDGADENVIKGIREAVLARELVKVTVLETCEMTAREAADVVADRLAADVVQVVGRRFVLYKWNKEANAYGIR